MAHEIVYKHGLGNRTRPEENKLAQVAEEAGAAGVVAGQGAAQEEALVGALAEALEGLSAMALADPSLAPKGGWSLGKGSRQTKGRSLPMERQ